MCLGGQSGNVSDASDERLKHLELLQNVVTRMAGNSMAAKGWSVALTAGLLGLASAEKSDAHFLVLALVPPVAFWFVDGYFMYLERCYRDRFTAVDKVPASAWKGFDMSPLRSHRGFIKDGLLRPAVFSIHLLVLALALAAWTLLR